MCCMLIHHPADAQPFSRAELDDFHRKNRAGFGVMWRWPGSGRVSYEKGLWSTDRIASTYFALYEHGCHEMVLHWRLATAGPVDLANAHPFETRNRVLIAHNGVLSHRSTEELSDTRCFIDDVLEPALLADRRAVNDRRWVAWLAGRIGGGNKVVLWPREARRPTIVGFERGVTYRGRWYSNTYAWSAPRGLHAREW